MRFSALLPLLALLACGPTTTTPDRLAIEEVLQRQRSDWNAGDLLGFMDGYSDSVCFLSKKGRTCGKAQVTAQYIRSYPDSNAMGKLRFDDLEILPDGDHAWCTGRWELVRGTKGDTLGGGFSLYWQRENGDWKILRDHTY